MIAAVRNHLIIAICAVATFSPCVADSKSVKDMFAEVSGGIVVVLALDAGGRQTGQGSGVVVGKNAVTTNCHVVSGARTIAVRQAADIRGHETYRMKAELIARNEQRDLCLLSVKELSAPPAATPVPFAAARSVSIGEEVYAIGAPQGLDLSISRGIVSQLRGDYGKKSAPIIQTDAAVSPGSSGGGLFNENGDLLGITTFKLSGGASEGLSFALPVEWVKELLAHAGVKITAGQERKRCFSAPTTDCLLTEALEVVKTGEIDVAHVRVSALVNIATAQAETGDKIGAEETLADAMQTARTIDDASARAEALGNIATAQAAAGDKIGARKTLTEAIQTAKEIDHASARAWVLQGIARAQAETGNNAGATQAAREINDARSRAWTLRDIARTQAKSGDIAGAVQTTGEITGVWKKEPYPQGLPVPDTFLKGYYDAYQDKFQDIPFEQFEGLVENRILQDPKFLKKMGDDLYNFYRHRMDRNAFDAKFGLDGWLKKYHLQQQNDDVVVALAGALSGIARAQAETGDKIGARKTLRDAMQTARTIDDAADRAEALLDIAKTQAEIGDIAGAMQIARTIDDTSALAGALSGIAKAQAETGDKMGARKTLSDAMQTARTINDAADRAEALLDIARAQTKTGDKIGAKETLADAVQTAKAIDFAVARAWVLQGTAGAQAEAGDKLGARKTLADAVQTAEEIASLEDFPEDFPLNSVGVMQGIARAQAEIGDITGAMKIAGTIDRAFRSGPLRDIARAQAETGDTTGAMDTASKIEEDDDLVVALAQIAVALSRIK